jgi:hypothetical protein
MSWERMVGDEDGEGVGEGGGKVGCSWGAWYGGGSSARSCVSELGGGSLEEIWGEGA